MLNEIKGGHSNKYAVVLNVHRDDIKECGIPEEICDKIDDDLLSEIAYKVEDSLLDCAFWVSLKTVIRECVELPDEGEEGE